METGRPQHDVEFKVEVDLIPPSEELVPVEFKSHRLVLGGKYTTQVRSFIWKKVDKLTVGDVEEEDTSRVFCGETGKLVLCFHHAGKNPYGQGTSDDDDEGSLRCATGYHGMTSFSVAKELLGQNGRHFIRDTKGMKTYFNISNVDEFAVVFDGESQETELSIFTVPQFVREAHGMAIVNVKREILASVKKGRNPLIKNALFGDGAEFQIDVAPGVDWTAVLAIVGGFGQDFENLRPDSLGEAFSEAFVALKHRFVWQ